MKNSIISHNDILISHLILYIMFLLELKRNKKLLKLYSARQDYKIIRPWKKKIRSSRYKTNKHCRKYITQQFNCNNIIIEDINIIVVITIVIALKWKFFPFDVMPFKLTKSKTRDENNLLRLYANIPNLRLIEINLLQNQSIKYTSY